MTPPSPDRPRPQHKVKVVPLACLWPHNLIAELLDPPTPDALTRLAARSGQGLAGVVEVGADNVVLLGWPFVLAARQAGQETAEVMLVRHLAGRPPEDVRHYVLNAHLERGSLPALAQLRFLQALHDLELGQCRWVGPYEWLSTEAIASHLNVSPRMAERYAALLRSDRAIQAVFDARRLPLVGAERLARLPPEEQRAIVDQLCQGADPRALVAALPPRSAPRRSSPSSSSRRESFRALARALQRLALLRDQESLTVTDAEQETLRQAAELLPHLMERAVPLTHLLRDRLSSPSASGLAR